MFLVVGSHLIESWLWFLLMVAFLGFPGKPTDCFSLCSSPNSKDCMRNQFCELCWEACFDAVGNRNVCFVRSCVFCCHRERSQLRTVLISWSDMLQDQYTRS